MLTYSTHRPPTFATIGAHVELGRAQPGRCGAASVGGIQCTRSGDALTCTLRPFALVANAYQRPSPHTMLGSGKSVPMAAGRNDWGGGPPLGGTGGGRGGRDGSSDGDGRLRVKRRSRPGRGAHRVALERAAAAVRCHQIVQLG